VLAVSVAAWVASLFRLICVSPTSSFYVYRGEVAYFHGIIAGMRGWHAQGVDWPVWNLPAGNRWLGFYEDFTQGSLTLPTSWGIVVPLWIPAAGAVAVLIATYLIGRGERTRARAELCHSCGYDLSGLGGRCPECGQEREA
jgi:hypothetical protein